MKNKITLKRVVVSIILLSTFILPQISAVGPGLLATLIIMYAFVIYASAWNLLTYSGQGSLGHAAFFGMGAYGSAILLSKVKMDTVVADFINVDVLIAVLVGSLFTSLIGVLIGLTVVRLREWFLGMATFGFAIIIHTITLELGDLTGGHDGLPARHLVTVPEHIIETADRVLFRYQMEYYIVLIAMILAIYTMSRIINSKFGLAFEAIRENELEAKVMGINTVKYKLVGFALSAFFSGIAGALLIHHIGYLTPDIFSVENSFKPIIYCISGGLFTIEGPVLGTVLVTAVWDGLVWAFEEMYDFLLIIGIERAHNLVLVIIGLMLALIVIFLPRGLISLIRRMQDRINSVFNIKSRDMTS